MSALEVTVYCKQGCHLCDVASEIVDLVVAQFPEDAVAFTEMDILSDPELQERYGEKIPVVFVGGELHAFSRVDSGRLRRAVTAGVDSGR